jgi:hypothetical protein
LNFNISTSDPRDVPDIIFACFNELISFDFNGIILDLITVLIDISVADIVIDLPLILEIIK